MSEKKEPKPDTAKSTAPDQSATPPISQNAQPQKIETPSKEDQEKEKENLHVEHGFVPNPNATPRQWKGEQRKLAFLDNYNRFITPAHTAQAIGITVRTFYDWCKDDPNFSKSFDVVDRHLTDRMIRIATSRAFRGSDNLLMFMLKSRDGRFRDKINAEINQGDIERIVSTMVAALRKTIPDSCPHCKSNLNLTGKVENMLSTLSRGVASQ